MQLNGRWSVPATPNKLRYTPGDRKASLVNAGGNRIAGGFGDRACPNRRRIGHPHRDSKTGEWKNSGSYRPSDIPILLVGLTKAMEYVYTTPLPGHDQPESAIEETQEIPF